MLHIPTNISGILIALILGATVCLTASIVIIVKHKKMPYEVWIPLLALCILIMMACIIISLCLAAAFTIAD